MILAWYIHGLSPNIIPLILVVLTSLSKHADAYITTVDASSEECFHEKAIAKTKIGFTFEVMKGGSLDIGVSIHDPDGQQLHNEEKSTSGKYTIEANKDGLYKYCFSNKMSHVTPKILMFSIETARQVQNKISGDEDQRKLDIMLKDLTSSVTSAKHELEYLSMRDHSHREINEHTNSRVIWWTWIELTLLIGVSLFQVHHIKRFFEIRRVI